MTQNGKNTAEETRGPLRFGTFELDAATGELRKSGVLIHLQPQPMRLLELLARRAGQLVTREEIQRELWNGETYVDFERSINICVMQIRAALGDDAETPRFVETLPRRGYRFVAQVHTSEASAGDISARSPSRGLLVTGGVLALFLIAGWFWREARTPQALPVPAGTRAMLAVLPFENLSGKAELDYVADGMTEELITQLGSLAPERLGVIARTSAMRYRGARESVAKISTDLGVQYLVEGSVRMENKRAWVTAQLIRANDQTHLWAETLERDGGSIFAIQQEVAARIAAKLGVQLLPAQNGTGIHRPRKPAAGEAYLQGLYLFHRGGSENVAAALQQLERAAAEDPEFAPAQAALADTLQFAAMVGTITAQEAAPRARKAAVAALAADAASSEAQAARGLVALWFDWDAQLAADHFTRAITANPSNADAQHDYAWVLVALGRDEEAVRAIEEAQRLDPVSPRASMDIGWIYLGLRRWDDAIRHCMRMAQIEPRAYVPAQSCLETAYRRKGDVAGAAAAALRQLERDSAQAALVEKLRAQKSEEILREVSKLRLEQRAAAATPRKAFFAAGLWLQLGDKAKALELLEQAFTEREMLLALLHRNPEFDALREEPRFKALLARVSEAKPGR